MESSLVPPTPDEAAAALGAADASRDQLVRGLRLPPLFHPSIGAAVAVQIATAAIGLAAYDTRPGPGLWLVVGGLAVFVVVAAVQLAAFRRINGVWVGGLAHRAVLGTSTTASTVEAIALGAALWAAFASRPWLAVVAAVAGGIGYAWSGRRWVRAYLADPASQARGQSMGWVVVLALLAVAGLVALMVGR